MADPAYPAARLVAKRVRDHFSRHRLTAQQNGETEIAAIPTEQVIETIVDTAFWTSLRREEKYSPRISMAFVSPDQAAPVMRFERALPLVSTALAKVAPGVERPGIHLGVWEFDGELRVWGATRVLPTFCFVVQTVAAGLLVIKHRNNNDTSAKFINVAVLEGDQIKILNHELSTLPGCPALLNSLLGMASTTPPASYSSNILIRLAVSMRAHGRGGSLLIVPGTSTTWRDSIAHPLSYSVLPPYSDLSEALRSEDFDNEGRRVPEAVLRAVDAVAGLTAIDGATVATDTWDVLAFGAKIIRKEGTEHVHSVAITEPIDDAKSEKVQVGQLGGTRHISAAQFAYTQQDALALVASQDGQFTIFAWSNCDETLYAYRVESLLI